MVSLLINTSHINSTALGWGGPCHGGDGEGNCSAHATLQLPIKSPKTCEGELERAPSGRGFRKHLLLPSTWKFTGIGKGSLNSGPILLQFLTCGRSVLASLFCFWFLLGQPHHGHSSVRESRSLLTCTHTHSQVHTHPHVHTHPATGDLGGCPRLGCAWAW